MDRVTRGLHKSFGIRKSPGPGAVGVGSILSLPGRSAQITEQEAMKLSAVSAAIDIVSDSMAKLPIRIQDLESRQIVRGHPLARILQIRPNEAMTPSVFKKMLEACRLSQGNGYAWIIRNSKTLQPEELIPVAPELVCCWKDSKGQVWYDITNPLTGEPMRLHPADMLHVKGFSHDGIHGMSTLARAAEIVRAGLHQQEYESAFYANGGQPGGVLQTDSDLSGEITVKSADGSKSEIISLRESVRREWEKVHSGPNNAHRLAVLDHGLQYKPIAISNADAQFVESKKLTIEDIARFFGVPLYKLQAGKQSYSSNEQNAIEYVTGKLHPLVVQYEEEFSYKLLPGMDVRRGLWITINMMAELRGDNSSRAQWYSKMREIGVFSVNDICALEDMPDVPGGDERYASLNYIPLEKFRELSISRNAKGGESNG